MSVHDISMLFQSFGLPVVIFLLWRLDRRDARNSISIRREDVEKVKNVIGSQREMIDRYHQMVSDVRDAHVMSAIMMQKLCDAIERNGVDFRRACGND